MIELSHSSLKGRDAKSLAKSVEAAVRQGNLAPGTKVPTVRALASRLRLSPTTVAAAYRALRQRGILKGEGRHGTRVSLRPPVAALRPEAVVMPNVRPAPPVSHAVSGRPSPSTSMTSVAAAPSGTPSPVAEQPDAAGVVGGVDGEVAESLGLALVLGLGEAVSVEEGASVGEAEVEDASVVGEELSLPPE